MLTTLCMIVFLNIPYLYVAKLKHYESFSKYKPLSYEKKEKKLGPEWEGAKVSLSKRLFILGPKYVLSLRFLVALGALILLSSLVEDRIVRLLFVSCVLSIPFFAWNPLAMLYAEKYLSLNQLVRLVESQVFIHVGFLLFGFAVFVLSIRCFRDRFGRRNWFIALQKNAIRWSGIVFCLIFGLFYYGQVRCYCFQKGY